MPRASANARDRAWQTGAGVTTDLRPPINLLATIGDPDGTRTVTSIIVLLVALGLALVMVAVWVYRTTRPDPELLAPLEVMGERKWRRADPVAQRRTLDDVRPDGARPLQPSVAPPTFDEAFDAGPSASGFDDLHGDGGDDVDDGDDGDDVDDRGDGRDDSDAARSTEGSGTNPSAAHSSPAAEVTPRQIERPDAEEFAHEIDPEVLSAAAAELDAELQHHQGDD